MLTTAEMPAGSVESFIEPDLIEDAFAEEDDEL